MSQPSLRRLNSSGVQTKKGTKTRYNIDQAAEIRTATDHFRMEFQSVFLNVIMTWMSILHLLKKVYYVGDVRGVLHNKERFNRTWDNTKKHPDQISQNMSWSWARISRQWYRFVIRILWLKWSISKNINNAEPEEELCCRTQDELIRYD